MDVLFYRVSFRVSWVTVVTRYNVDVFPVFLYLEKLFVLPNYTWNLLHE